MKNQNKIEVFIYLPGESEAVSAGQYRYDPKMGAGVFIYHKNYLTSKEPMAVDPVNLPLNLETLPKIVTLGPNRVGRDRLFGVLRDSVPDSWGRTLMTYLYGLPVRNPDPEDLLRFSNNQRVGNLDFRENIKDSEKPGVIWNPVDWDKLISTVRNFELGLIQPLERDSLLYLERTSLGGAKPKTLLFDGEHLWLAKLPSITDLWNDARIEYATMTLAAQCGLKVPEMKIESVGEADVLLSKRFDRICVNSNFLRTGYFSCQTVLEGLARPDLERSYLNFVDALRMRFPKSWSRKMGMEMFERMCFNILVRNTDDHPLNHGLLHTREGVQLAPAFDICPEFSRKNQTEPFKLNMECGPQGKMATWGNVLEGAGHFGLDKDQAATLIRNLAAKVKEWRKVFDWAGVSEGDMAKIEGAFESPLHLEALELEPGSEKGRIKGGFT
jgi:serine/threonine-protein kinase HipA